LNQKIESESSSKLNLIMKSVLISRKVTKNAGFFQSKFGSNMDKPKCWVKNAI